MNKSLRNRLFFRTLIALVLVVCGNRLVSHWLSQAYVMTSVETGIGLILGQCDSDGARSDPADFRRCARQVTEGILFENLALELTVCPPGTGANGTAPGLPAVCGPVLGNLVALAWRDVNASVATGLQRAEAVLEGVNWVLFRASAPAAETVVLVRQGDIVSFLERIWRIRDWIFIYVVPLSIVGIVGMTWIMMQQLMTPLRQMQESISRLSSSNLSQPVKMVNPYREFAELAAAFDDLRGRLQASFMQSQRFAADASHELRTPLTILRGHVEQAIDELPAGSSTQVHLRVIEDEITRMANVTEKLLLLSRVDADAVRLTLDPLDLSELMHALVRDAKAIQSSLAITAEIEPNTIWHCDSQLVRQLVYNLFTNALNYNVPEGWVHFRLQAVAGWLELTVENPSDSFTPEHEAKVFDRFYRGNASRTRQIDGLGLGLSLCREIAHLHHGTVTLAASLASPPCGWDVVCASLRAPLKA